MPRPGQQASRRKRKNQGDSDDNTNSLPSSAQVLPVADLPEDFDGVADDGATYLALSSRANAKLPFYTRALPIHLSGPDVRPAVASNVEQQASGSRHPALPRESWEVTFSAHFVAKRTQLHTNWPPDPQLPYPSNYPPIPSSVQYAQWKDFINGRGSDLLHAKGTEIESDQEDDYYDDMLIDNQSEAELIDDDDSIQEDEEAWFNAAPPPEIITSTEAALADDELLRPREPEACILQKLDTHRVMSLLRLLTRWMTDSIDRLPSTSATLLAAHPIPETVDELHDSASEYEPRPNPFPAINARWAFALLLTLDPHLTREQLSSLRDLARACATVAAWRWKEALADPERDLPQVPVLPGFVPGEVVEGNQAVTWMLGAKWKRARDKRPRSEATPRPQSAEADYDETGVDETLARCWLVAQAVIAGWAQWDLTDDFARLFRRLPRG